MFEARNPIRNMFCGFLFLGASFTLECLFFSSNRRREFWDQVRAWLGKVSCEMNVFPSEMLGFDASTSLSFLFKNEIIFRSYKCIVSFWLTSLLQDDIL